MYNLVRPILKHQIGKEWNMEIWNAYLVDESKYCLSSNFLELCLSAQAATFLLPEENNFPFHGDHVIISPEAAALKNDIFFSRCTAPFSLSPVQYTESHLSTPWIEKYTPCSKSFLCSLTGRIESSSQSQKHHLCVRSKIHTKIYNA